MATHNPQAALLRKQIESLVAQTVRDWRCLVLDDASVDRREVASLFARDPRFELLPPEPHLGAYRAFEALLAHADAESPVFLCDQDDFWHPAKLERMLEYKHTTFSAMRVVSESGHILRRRFLASPPEPTALTPARILLMNPASGAAMMVTPRVRRAAIPFPAPHLRGWHDQWLAAVASRIDELNYLDDALVDYTQHPGQVVGDGVRRLTPARVTAYGRRIRAVGLRSDLTSRTGWVMAAASRLLELDSTADQELARTRRR